MKIIYATPLFALLIALLWFLTPATAHAAPTTPTVAAFPFSDNFESGTIGPDWSSDSAGSGRIEISDENPYRGSYSLFLGRRTTGTGRASLMLNIDLANQDDVWLDFWWRADGAVSDDDSAVYLSANDGTTWTKIYLLNGNAQSYMHAYMNLADIAADRGIVLNDHMLISFQYGSYITEAVGGLRIDDIRLTTRSQIVTTFPTTNAIDSDTFIQGFYPQAWGTGIAEITENDPHSGTYTVFLGRKTGGRGGASLHWVVDLSNQEDVWLDFWWRASGDSIDQDCGVYISVDDGTTWKKLANLSSNRQFYGHEYINLSDAAADRGLLFNNRVRLSFHFESTITQDIGNLLIDDLRLTTRPTIVAPEPFAEPVDVPTFSQGIYPQGWGAGIVEINSDAPHTGEYNIFLGRRIQNRSGAAIHLVTDLANHEQAYLDFWWRATGSASDQDNGVYLSTDHGTSWHRLIRLSGSPTTYNHVIIDLAEAAADRGLTLNDATRISIAFESTISEPVGGLLIDDINIGSVDPRQANTSLLYLPLIQR